MALMGSASGVANGSVGSLACSPFHVRFGKFSLLRPYEKKVISYARTHLSSVLPILYVLVIDWLAGGIQSQQYQATLLHEAWRGR